MLKDSCSRKRRRSELEEVKEEETKLKMNKQQYLREAKRMKKDYGELEDEVIQLRGIAGIAEGLNEIGLNQQDVDMIKPK